MTTPHKPPVGSTPAWCPSAGTTTKDHVIAMAGHALCLARIPHLRTLGLPATLFGSIWRPSIKGGQPIQDIRQAAGEPSRRRHNNFLR
jgi:hypothetical protein